LTYAKHQLRHLGRLLLGRHSLMGTDLQHLHGEVALSAGLGTLGDHERVLRVAKKSRAHNNRGASEGGAAGCLLESAVVLLEVVVHADLSSLGVVEVLLPRILRNYIPDEELLLARGGMSRLDEES